MFLSDTIGESTHFRDINEGHSYNISLIFRGAMYNSRLANYYQDRFIGFVYYTVAYMAPSPPTKYEDMMAAVSMA